MRPIIPILGLLSALWIFAGTWWLSSSCALNSVSTAVPTGFSVSDGSFKTTAPDNFYFLQSSEREMGYTNKVQGAFKDIATYLNDNPERMLILNGLYAGSEDNITSHENLGIARAQTIRNLLVKLGTNAENIKVQGTLQEDLSFVGDERKLMDGVLFSFGAKAEEPEETTEVTIEEPTTIAGYDSDNKKMTIVFKGENIDYTPTPEFETFIKDVKKELQKNPNAKIMVTGLAASDGESLDMAETRSKKVRRVLRDIYKFESKKVLWDKARTEDIKYDKAVIITVQ